MSVLKIVVPLTPPSANMYMRTAVINGQARHYPSAETKAWWRAVAIFSRGQTFEAKDFEIAYVVYQGSNERGDVDNYSKCIFDALVKAKVIDSDHKVYAMHAYKSRSRDSPRTEIFIRAAGQLSLLDPPMPSLNEW